MAHFHFSPRPNRAHEINWHAWNADSFAEAKASDKLILLGISAVWCHWCHVMDETSYSDDQVIRLINERFIPIRVDNDQRPDVNRRYNLGGWPTTAFLTPDGEVLTGGTYIPPSQMRTYLHQVSEAYAHDKQDILAKIGEMNLKREQAMRARTSSGVLSQKIIDTLARDVYDNFDSAYGGFGSEPKFPHTDAIELALERYHATRDEKFLAVVTVTLTHMASGGTYDQVAGGFFRYSTTRDWSVPHFEKMLEDNAKLMTVLARAYRVEPRDIFRDTMRTMVAYLTTTLSDQVRGGFYGSQDADEHYYTLSLDERAKLTAPYVDKNFYTDWNALMVSGYLEAGRVLGDESLQTSALKTLDRIWNAMYRTDTGLFHFATPDNAPQLPNQLLDLAHTTRAFLDAYQFTGDANYLSRAQTLADLALEKLYDADADAGVFWGEPHDHEILGLLRLPDRSLVENAIIADVLVRLSRVTGEMRYRDIAEKALTFFASSAERFGFMASEYARAVSHLLTEPVTVHIVGNSNDARTRELMRAALDEYAPAKIVQVLDPGRDANRLVQLGYPANDAPLAYVCVGTTCLAPVGRAEDVVAGMRQLRA